MYPETAAAGVWSSSNDLLKIAMDLSKSYKDNSGILLKQNTLKLMFVTQENCKWGLGAYIYVSPKSKQISFSHGGQNYGYKMEFHCWPMEGKCTINLKNYNPCHKNGLKNARKNARKLVK